MSCAKQSCTLALAARRMSQLAKTVPAMDAARIDAVSVTVAAVTFLAE